MPCTRKATRCVAAEDDSSATPSDPHSYMPLDLSYPGPSMVNVSPPIYLCHDFLSAAECDELIGVAEPMLHRSSTLRFESAREDTGRTSHNCELAKYWTQASALLAKVAELTSKPVEHIWNCRS